MDKVVLVTGGMGFIGSYVAAEYAERGWKVVLLGHVGQSYPKPASARLTVIPCDVTLDNLIAYAGQPDVIVHCAGSGSVNDSLREPLLDFEKSVRTTTHVLEYCRLHSPGTRIVFPSSAAVYGNASGTCMPEETPLQPVSPYGVHKLLAEQLCKSYANYFGLRIAIVRMFSVIGRGLKKQLLWDACVKVKNRDYLFYGTGDEVRDWIHATDAAALLYVAAGKASEACPVVNAGSGKGVKVRDVLLFLFAQMGCVARPQFSNGARKGDPNHYVADISRATGWGWAPKMDVVDCIEDYIEWIERDVNGTGRIYHHASQ
ncbi:NAD-dependent epimerase/dehydratase family protein [Cohnella sp. GCM10027633]|uniref:NAD-dependent epimerase/dehydratase family protein n=1 Tax=unclassified Cohnella TaxID=2636738 RepID=UPI0036437C49